LLDGFIVSYLKKEIMLVLQNISYLHPNKDWLFDNIHLTINNYDKVALIGNNGSGKSTLLKIIAKEILPSYGQIMINSDPYYIPQIFGQYDDCTIAEVLKIDIKLNALKEILKGNVTDENLSNLNDDWTVEERSLEALRVWNLDITNLNQTLGTLSGGQKVKVYLAGISIHKPRFILMDEPSNHLDVSARQQLYNFISASSSTIMVVSHDRKLLDLLNITYELTRHGIKSYGGNYDFYKEQKSIERNALNQDINAKEKALRKAKEKERETLERQQKLDARGKKKQEKAGVARIMMNTLKNNAEKSTSKIKTVHDEKMEQLADDLKLLRSSVPDIDKIKFGFDNSIQYHGKILFTAKDVNFSYQNAPVWKLNLNLLIKSGERISLKGANGTGKSTLIHLILGNLEPKTGTVHRSIGKSIFIDQDYSLIANKLNVYQQAQQFNGSGLEEHEVKIRLNRFLFGKDDWDKPCHVLSGGERMRLTLCCLTIYDQSPDMIVLDEPTNNLDLQNIELLIAAIKEYHGTLIVVSHDEGFLEQVNINRIIELD